MQQEEETWCLIESDPGVFTELMRGIGVQGAQVEEVYSLDPESLSFLPPIYAFIFLFKWEDESKHEESPCSTVTRETLGEGDTQLYFAKQMIRNACATQAIINIGLNISSNFKSVSLSPELQEFKDFTQDFTPEYKGFSLSNCAYLKNLHNSFARVIDSYGTNEQQQPEEESFHFVGILPFVERDTIHVVELDGLSSGPKILVSIKNEGPSGQLQVGDSAWVDALLPILMDRMNSKVGEIKFSLMAVVQDRLDHLNEKLRKLDEKASSSSSSKERQDLLDDIRAEKETRVQQANMNMLRKHDLLPAIKSLCNKYPLL